jgi:hypothetical protein
MRLMQVQTDTETVCGIERHTFRCSACPQTAQRLMFNRARMSGIHLPVVATQPKAPVIEVQTASVARPSDWARAIEKLSSTQKALKGRLAAETSSQRVSADKVLASRPIALRERTSGEEGFGLGQRDRQARSKQTALERVARVKTTNGAAITDRATQFEPHLGRSAPRYPGGRGTTAASILGAAQAAAALSGPPLRPTLCLETVRHFAAALGELRHDLPV